MVFSLIYAGGTQILLSFTHAYTWHTASKCTHEHAPTHIYKVSSSNSIAMPTCVYVPMTKTYIRFSEWSYRLWLQSRIRLAQGTTVTTRIADDETWMARNATRSSNGRVNSQTLWSFLVCHLKGICYTLYHTYLWVASMLGADSGTMKKIKATATGGHVELVDGMVIMVDGPSQKVDRLLEIMQQLVGEYGHKTWVSSSDKALLVDDNEMRPAPTNYITITIKSTDIKSKMAAWSSTLASWQDLLLPKSFILRCQETSGTRSFDEQVPQVTGNNISKQQ